MAKKIVFNNGTEDVTLNITNCFAYSYNAEKNVLKIEINENAHSYDEIAALKLNSGSINLFENDDLKSEYTGYTLGAEGFTCNYSKGVFSVELERKNEVDIRIDAIWESIGDILDIIME